MDVVCPTLATTHPAFTPSPHPVQLRTSDVLLGSELLTRVMDKSKLKQALSQ